MSKKLSIFLIGVVQVIAANATVIQQTPISLSPKPNIILAYDDSGSMADTVIPDTPSPALTTESTTSFWYNPLAYNPTITYIPWVKTKTSSGLTYYPDAPLKTVLTFNSDGSDPITSGSSLVSGTTYKVTYSCNSGSPGKYNATYDYDTGAKFSVRTTCQNKSGSIYIPSTSYTVLAGQSWQKGTYSSNAMYYSLVASCASGATCVTAPVCTTTSTCGVTLSGAKLQQVTIDVTDTANLQNYANWLMYANSRKNMVAYAMSKVLPSLVGVNIGFQPFNSSSTSNANTRAVDSSVTSVTYAGSTYYSSSGRMYNMDLPSDVTTLLDLIYNTESSNATPTRTTLLKIGNQFSNKTLSYSSYSNDGTAVSNSKGIVQFACQKNAAFVLTDGYTNESPSLTMPAYQTGKTDQTYATKRPYWNTATSKSQFSTSLADIALRFYTNNIRDDLTVGQVPTDTYSTVNADGNTNLHMNTYALTLGATGAIYGTTTYAAQTTNPFTSNPTFVDPTTATNNTKQIDDLWHSTINGRGMMFQSTDPSGLVTQIENGIMHVILSAGTRASIAVANKYMDASNNAVYIPSYYIDANGTYLGDVKKYTVTLATQTIDIANADWSASTMLNAVSTPATTRKIVTYNGSVGASFSAATTSLNANLVAYVRGDKSLEGTTYRKRAALFGDVINASPTVVQLGSTITVYQAANDGMLHAIDAATGNELWAYVPKAVWGQFTNYAAIGGAHKYIVDGTPTYGKVGIKTILVGGLGYNNTASTFYALDITTSTAADETAAAAKVLWEFPGTTVSAIDGVSNKANLGTSTSQPVIANTKAFGTVVIVSSGYNNGTGTIDGVVQTGGDGKGHVWFIKPTTDANGTAGTVLAELVTSGGTTSAPIGLASLAGFIANARIDTNISALYGGDEVGNVWKFNVSATASSSWTSSKVASGLQSITSAPNLGVDPVDNKPIIYVGTGQLLNASDITDTATQSFYALKDVGSTLTTSNIFKWVMGSDRNITAPCSITDTDIANYNKGWYFDFPIGGERVVGDIQFNSGVVMFKTNVISSNTCSDQAYNWTVYPPKTPLFKRNSCPINCTTPDCEEPKPCLTDHCATETKASTSSTIIFYKGKIEVVKSDGTITDIGTYMQGRQMGAWREIIRK
jgi:type IV pilus assembly protein PilY1